MKYRAAGFIYLGRLLYAVRSVDRSMVDIKHLGFFTAAPFREEENV